MHYILKSVSIALQNIRANPLHTFLSTLGIIIGVAALVGILALGDGLEQAGRNQLAKTTSIQSFTVTSKSKKLVDGVSVSVQNRPKITYQQAREIQARYAEQAVVEYVGMRTTQVMEGDSLYGVYLHGSMERAPDFLPEPRWVAGRFFTSQEVERAEQVAVVSKAFADRLNVTGEEALDRTLSIQGSTFRIIGVLDIAREGPRIVVPITVFDKDGTSYPALTMKVKNAEEIPSIKEEMSVWLDQQFEQGSSAFDMKSDDFWIQQFSEGILLFKLIMGAITGISVLVGGIGIMNVLLISVTERTKEIGIRKANGAKKKDIVFQFLAESVTVSLVGSILGWIFGMVGIFLFVPIVNNIVSLTFEVIINPVSVLIILVVAILIGICFGTYPAWRAANLNPVDAIRHE